MPWKSVIQKDVHERFFILYFWVWTSYCPLGGLFYTALLKCIFNNGVGNKFVTFTENALLSWHLSIIIINYRVKFKNKFVQFFVIWPRIGFLSSVFIVDFEHNHYSIQHSHNFVFLLQCQKYFYLLPGPPILTRNLRNVNSVNPRTIRCPLYVGRILNVHKTFRRRPGLYLKFRFFEYTSVTCLY